MEFKYPARATLIAAQFFLCENDLLAVRNFSVVQCYLSRLFKRYEERFFVLFKYRSEYCIYAVSPLSTVIVEHEVVVRRFDSAAHELFHREHNFVAASCVGHGNSLCPADVYVIIKIDYLAGFCVDFIDIFKLRRAEFQYPARATLIAIELFLRKDDLLGSVNSGVLKSDFSRFLQGNEHHSCVLFDYIAVYCVYMISPLSIFVSENKAIIRCSNADINKRRLCEFNPEFTARIIQCDCLCLCHSYVF